MKELIQQFLDVANNYFLRSELWPNEDIEISVAFLKARNALVKALEENASEEVK